MSGLKRSATAVPMQARMSHYAPDGTGRDSYVTLQNGGIWKEIQIQCTRPEIGTFAPRRQYKVPNPIMVPKFRHYQSDGSGRDNYVIQDEGGLAPSSTKFKKRTNFFNSLRDYEKYPIQPQNDFFRLAQTPSAQSFKSYMKAEIQSQSQKNLTKKLNMPKISEDPYKSLRTLSTPFYGRQKEQKLP